MVNAIMAAGHYRRMYHYRDGIYGWVFGKPVVRVGYMGLQPDAGEHPGAGLPAIFCSVGDNCNSRDYFG